MFELVKTKITSIKKSIEIFLFGTEDVRNTYCIPCTWVITGKVYVDAPNADLAKAYVRTQKINPDLEDCYCLNMKPDTDHPFLCECGNCGKEYIISKYHIHPRCPYCENGGELA